MTLKIIYASRDAILVSHEKLRAALSIIAAQITTEEGDIDATEDGMGLSMPEVVYMAHDNLIFKARSTLNCPKVFSE